MSQLSHKEQLIAMLEYADVEYDILDNPGNGVHIGVTEFSFDGCDRLQNVLRTAHPEDYR